MRNRDNYNYPKMEKMGRSHNKKKNYKRKRNRQEARWDYSAISNGYGNAYDFLSKED